MRLEPGIGLAAASAMAAIARLRRRAGSGPRVGWRAALARIALLLACCAIATAHAADAPAARFIEVTGQSEMQAAPDRALLDFGVVTRAQTAQGAVQQNAQRMQAVLAALRPALGAKDQIGTGNFTLRPEYAQQREPGPPQLIGYSVSNVVRVQTGELNTLGALIDIAIKAGANQVEQVRFVLQEAAALRQRALRDAVADARAQAEAIAAGLSVRLGAIESVVEQDTGPVRPFQEGVALRAQAAAATPIEPGVVSLQARVRAKWRLEDAASP